MEAHKAKNPNLNKEASVASFRYANKTVNFSISERLCRLLMIFCSTRISKQNQITIELKVSSAWRYKIRMATNEREEVV